jgi:hypothetical protein
MAQQDQQQLLLSTMDTKLFLPRFHFYDSFVPLSMNLEMSRSQPLSTARILRSIRSLLAPDATPLLNFYTFASCLYFVHLQTTGAPALTTTHFENDGEAFASPGI